MIEIRYVQPEDKEFWYHLDKHLPERVFPIKVRDRQGYVLTEDGMPKGLLRYSLFWDNTPFCNMLYVDASAQGKGHGRRLMEYWQADMKAQGYGMVFTSTQEDESAQHFYRKLGYMDCGSFRVDIPGYAQAPELLLCKAL